jgi:anthranilate phosphoribosyltransferase
MPLRDLLRVLGSSDTRDGRNLTHDEAYRAFQVILSGEANEIQIAAFLMAMRWKGVRVDELTGFARAARERATLPCKGMSGLVCVSPPHDGHDAIPPLDAAAGLVAAAAGARVLLISDRCVPPKRGLTAVSVLQYIGTGVTWDAAEAEDWVAKARFAAIAVSGMLPEILNLREVRRSLGVRTPLHTVEKLIAPASAAVVLGAQHGPVLGTAVETIAGLGHPRGIAIQGVDGGVIPTVRRRTRGIELTGTHQVPLAIEPADFGLAESSDPELPLYGPPPDGEGTGDNPLLVEAAGCIVEGVLRGEPGPARNATLLGAAIILKAAGRALTIAEGVDQAVSALDAGEPQEVLARVRALAG